MSLPSEVLLLCQAELESWRGDGGPTRHSAAVRDTIETVFACSRYIARQCALHPEILDVLDAGDRLSRIATRGEIARSLEDQLSPADEADEPTRAQLLRRARHLEMVRIGWRDIAGSASVDETLADLSELADACVAIALRWAHAAVRETHGDVRDTGGAAQSLIVVAMGKLGGEELNYSSDIDLVLLYPGAGTSDGKRPLDSDQYFARVGQRLIYLLDHVTADGFVFRVDMRLRPFGSSGALAISLGAFENYLQQHGREWEHYAYVKARPLGCSAGQRAQFSELVRPFVYRRYLDYGVFESLRDMKTLITADVQRRERHDDIKLGPGGIREIEFIVQAFQLLRGGGDPALRNPSLRAVLPLLVERRCLDAQAGEQLQAAYAFLRRTENHLQVWDDAQVHELPDDTPGRLRLCHSMGFDDWHSFRDILDKHRGRVTHYFNSTVLGTTGEISETDTLAAIWKNDPGTQATVDELEALGFADPAAVQNTLKTLHDSGQYRHLDKRGRDRLDALIPRLLRLAAGQDNADRVVARLLRIVDAVGRRSAYFALLIENPSVLERLANLVSASPWIARRVAERPILLDELIDPRMFEIPPAREDFVAELQRRFASVESNDLERQMESLRLFQQASVFRVAIADLSGVLPLMKVSDRLTDIAELVLDKVVELAQTEMQARYGIPRCKDSGDLREARFAVIGYGKLGGLELGYASDLDLVFLHDSDGEDQLTDGEKSVDNDRYFARLGQRILHVFNTTTVSGVLYEVDTRLRPNGNAGPIVSTLQAFENYQRESAWTWELQALLRSRAVAGSALLMGDFERLRCKLLTREQDPDKLRDAVSGMRERMRRELPGGGPGRFDIKRDAGGLTDIEFLVQFWVLKYAEDYPELVYYSDNIRQLESLARVGLVDPDMAESLADIYRAFRKRLHRLALADAPGIVAESEFVEQRRWVANVWNIVFTDKSL